MRILLSRNFVGAARLRDLLREGRIALSGKSLRIQEQV